MPNTSRHQLISMLMALKGARQVSFTGDSQLQNHVVRNWPYHMDSPTDKAAMEEFGLTTRTLRLRAIEEMYQV